MDATAILPGADIQRVVGAILDGPVLARQLQEAGGIGFIRSQAGHNPDRLNFLAPAFEFPNAVNPRHLCHMRKAHLGRGHLPDLDPAPFDSAVALLDLQELRGKKLPGGSGALDLQGLFGCP